jgi:hypothetical protein
MLQFTCKAKMYLEYLRLFLLSLYESKLSYFYSLFELL